MGLNQDAVIDYGEGMKTTIMLRDDLYRLLKTEGKKDLSEKINAALHEHLVLERKLPLTALAGLLSKREGDDLEREIKEGRRQSAKRSKRLRREMHDL